MRRLSIFSILLMLVANVVPAAGDTSDCLKKCGEERKDCNKTTGAICKAENKLCEKDSESAYCDFQHCIEAGEDCVDEEIDCDNACNNSSSGDGSAETPSDQADCRPPYKRDLLGRCVGEITHSGVQPDQCPPGADDGCRPDVSKLLTLKAPVEGDGWFVLCPRGSKVGPIGGCAIDIPDTGGGDSGDENFRDCPPGKAGTDDGCVPIINPREIPNLRGYNLLRSLIGSGALKPEDVENVAGALEASHGVIFTRNPREVLEKSAEALGGEVHNPR